AVHARAATAPGRERVRHVVAALRPPGWTLLEGRRVAELRARDMPTKADAVLWIAARRPAATILYVGDDVTDEDAFRALRRRDFPVLVDAGTARAEQGRGRGRATHARFSLAGTDAVRELVEALGNAPPRRTPRRRRSSSARR